MDRNQSLVHKAVSIELWLHSEAPEDYLQTCLSLMSFREFEDFDFIAAAAPTIFASANPQILYLSNAGTERSVVLNDLKQRAGQSGIAYLEWSAAPHRAADDHEGWLEANPSIGYGNQTIERLQSLYDKYESSAQLAVFETEHLCRWVK